MTTNNKLLILTGGTIGVNIFTSGEGYNVQGGSSIIADNFERYLRQNEMAILEVSNILSENIDFNFLENLRNNILSNQSKYDIILIFHGTDSLVYTASFIDLTIKLSCPILFISTQRTFNAPSYELTQILKLLDFEKLKGLKNRAYIINYKAVDTLEFLNPLTSYKLHSYKKGCFVSRNYLPSYILENNYNLKKIELGPSEHILFKKFYNQIPIIHCTPNMSLQSYSFKEHTKKVIIVGYGLGNISKNLAQQIEYFPKTKFYIISNMLGDANSNVYQNKKLSNIVYSQNTIQHVFWQCVLNK